eukprot:m.237587 g.237587  ORF g.237587 m.237587 type:complete len:377 (+) comp33710_c2_seq2:265-1395(+)
MHGDAKMSASSGHFSRMISEDTPPATTVKQPTSAQTQIQHASFVLPSKFFEEAQRACATTDLSPQMDDTHLFDHTDTPKSLRRLRLVSPLMEFLTNIKNKATWIQLAGHKGSFIPGKGGILCKKTGERELKTYEALNDLVDEALLRHFVPLYYKNFELAGELYVELEDLLAKFNNPSIMDIKMGIRTFLENEVVKTSRRKDLLAKMVAIDPDEPTEEEKLLGITKLRYMEFREIRSSSRTLGFRIEGIKRTHEKACNDFKTVKTSDDAKDAINLFLPTEGPLRETVLKKFSERLYDLRDALEHSPFFSRLECVGSSLLFLYDQTGRVGIWMIDFGKTEMVEVSINHRVPWKLGNKEDGYLFGLDNLTGIFVGNSTR